MTKPWKKVKKRHGHTIHKDCSNTGTCNLKIVIRTLTKNW